MKLLTKDEVMGMGMHKMSDYLNEVCKANELDPFLVWQDGKLFDVDAPEFTEEYEIKDAPDLYDYLLDYNIYVADLQGKVFADD